jgi:hypothetical protein
MEHNSFHGRPLTSNTKKRESNVTTTSLLTEIPTVQSYVRDSNGLSQNNIRNTSPLMVSLVKIFMKEIF